MLKDLEPKRGERLLALALLLLIFGCYYPVLSFGLVWDDESLRFLRNFYLRTDFLRLAFAEPYGLGSYYRPLPTLWMAWESFFLGVSGSARIGHGINLFIFFAITWLLILLCRKLNHLRQIPYPWLPWLCGAIFAVHPALLAGPGWISTRFDLSVTLLALAMLWLPCRQEPSLQRSLWVASLFGLALLCKETAIMLLVIYPLWLFWLAEQGEASLRLHTYSGIRQETSLLLLVLFFYLALRISVIGFVMPADTEKTELGVMTWLARWCETIGHMGQQVFFPHTAMQPVFPPPSHYSLARPYSLAGIFLMLLLAMCFFRHSRSLTLGLLMVLASVLPVMNLFFMPMDESLTATWYVFLPIALISVVFVPGWLVAGLQRARLVTMAVIATWLTASAFTVHGAVVHWRNNISFWSWYVEAAPASFSGNFFLAKAYFDDKQFTEALIKLDTMQVREENAVLWVSLRGFSHLRLGHLSQAEMLMQEGLAQNISKGERTLFLSGLAESALMQGDMQKAKRYLQESLLLNPYGAYSLLLATELALHQGDATSAADVFSKLRRVLHPDVEIRIVQFRDYGIADDRLKKLFDSMRVKHELKMPERLKSKKPFKK